MAKGVVLGVLTVIFVLPAILLVLDGPIQKYHHKCFTPNFDKINGFIIRNRVKFFILFLIVFIPAVYSEKHTQVYYKLDQSLPQTMGMSQRVTVEASTAKSFPCRCARQPRCRRIASEVSTSERFGQL